jgi:hypothetical protein
MIGHLVVEIEPAEPSVSEMQLDAPKQMAGGDAVLKIEEIKELALIPPADSS